MAHSKKLVSPAASVSSSKTPKSPKRERREAEPLSIDVTFSSSNPVDIQSEEDFVNNLSNKEEVISIDNSLIEELNVDLSEVTCKKLVIVGTDSLRIVDEDGSVFSTLMSKLSDAASIRTLVLTGHDFPVLQIPAEFPESITTLVFDNCNIEDIAFEENAAPSLTTLVFQKINSLASFTFPHYACASLSQLKFNRMVCKKIDLEDSAIVDGTVLEISGCKYLEEVTIGDDCFTKGESIIMSRNSSMTELTIGKNCFEEASSWNMVCTELRSITFGGNNFINLEEVDFTPMPELTEIIMGKGTFQNSMTLICEELGKLRKLIFGDYSFESGKKIYIINSSNLRQLSFGKRSFRSLTYDNFSVCELPRLETLEFGESCLAKMERFVLLKNQCLKTVVFGKGCLKNCQYFVLLNYLNRVHIEEHDGKVTFIPEEYPGLPQEAEILCQPGSCRIEVCPRLSSVEFGKDCLPSIQHFEMSYLHKLKSVTLPDHFAEECQTFIMSDNAKLDTLEIPEGCFRSCKYFSLQNHPELHTFVVEKNVMSEGGFTIMRNLYPTTISVDKNSFLLDAASYKSIPNKLRRSLTKNLTKFQAKIASDAFLGQALVDTIGVVGIVAVLIIFMI